MVVASQESTRITTTTAVNTNILKPANVPFTIKLNKGKVYQVQSKNTLSDAFRPNSENADNRLFMPVEIGADPNRFHFLAYGSWGQLVLESKNPENKWDGKLKKGRNAPTDNYVWFAEFHDIRGFKHQQKCQVLHVR